MAEVGSEEGEDGGSGIERKRGGAGGEAGRYFFFWPKNARRGVPVDGDAGVWKF